MAGRYIHANLVIYELNESTYTVIAGEAKTDALFKNPKTVLFFGLHCRFLASFHNQILTSICKTIVKENIIFGNDTQPMFSNIKTNECFS